MPDPEPTLIAINPVLAERADDFEQWLRSVVLPAVRAHRPEQLGRFHVVRGTEVEDDTVVFAFLFFGGTPDEWELQPLLEQALGPEKAERAMTTMTEMLKQEQYGWSFAPVQLDR